MSERISSDFRPIVRRLRGLGYTVEPAKGSSHYAVRDEQGKRIATLTGSKTDPRSAKNFRAQLRRMGIKV